MSPTSGTGSARFRGVEGRAGAWVLGGLAVVLAVLLVGIGLAVGGRSSGDDDLTARQHEVAAAARAEATAFLTVDHEDMEPLVDAVLAGATGDFAEQYASQRDTLVEEAVRTEATSRPEVVSLGVGDQDDDSATVLVAANSRVTNAGTSVEGQTRYYRLRLTLVREDDRWLTSDLEFVR
jgi:Mce-associated membrane protein